jgi:hypothetical protein
MKSLSRSIAVLAMLVATVAGCAGSDSGGGSATKPGTSTAKHATGDTITADAFSYTVPKGWKETRQSTLLSLAIDPHPVDGFRTSINVVSDDTIVGTHGEELEKAVKKVLTSFNAKDIEIRDRLTIDGEDAVHSSAVMNINGNEYRVEQYGVEHDDAGFFVTLSFSLSIPQKTRDEISGSILSTWTWSS